MRGALMMAVMDEMAGHLCGDRGADPEERGRQDDRERAVPDGSHNGSIVVAGKFVCQVTALGFGFARAIPVY